MDHSNEGATSSPSPSLFDKIFHKRNKPHKSGSGGNNNSSKGSSKSQHDGVDESSHSKLSPKESPMHSPKTPKNPKTTPTPTIPGEMFNFSESDIAAIAIINHKNNLSSILSNKMR